MTDGGDLLQGLAGEHLTFDGQASTLIIVEQNATLAELFLENLIFSTHFHKYGDVCWERDGAQIEARRRVDAGTSPRKPHPQTLPYL